jgi:YidC/Oxa1 family membrane protein insertase
MIDLIFYHLFYRPIFNFLVFLNLYLPSHDLGLTILIFTLLVRLILYPLNVLSQREQKKMGEIQKKLKEIQEKFKEDKEKTTQKTLKLLKEEKINPFWGFLFFVIQLPAVLVIFFILKNINHLNFNDLYSFLPKNLTINPYFFGFLDLSKSFLNFSEERTIYYWPGLLLLFFSILISFFQIKMQQKSYFVNPSNRFQKNIPYFILGISLIFLSQLPLGIVLYFLITSVISLIEQNLILKKIHG